MHRSRALLAVALTVALTLGSAAPALAATQSDAAAHAAKAATARAKAKAAQDLAAKLKAETAALDDKIAVLQKEADALDPQIAEATSRTKRLFAEVKTLQAEVDSTQANIERTQADYDLQQSLLGDRVEATYRQGDWFYFDVLLGSQDFNDLIARTELVSRVIESNNNIATQLARTKRELEFDKVKLGRSLAAADLKRKEAQAVENKLRSLQSTRQYKADQQEAIYDQKAEMMAESSANAKRLLAIAAAEEAESSRIERELANHSGSGKYNGTMAWPVPGFYNVTSSFGWRIHPIFKTKKFHTGIDIGKNGGQSIDGASIVAAGDGEVIYAGARNGYGNTVMIDHGDGVVTLYAHQQSGGIKVSVGQSVKKGERIGTVGMTGYSTGPHLHFEVRVNGNPVNPMGYL